MRAQMGRNRPRPNPIHDLRASHANICCLRHESGGTTSLHALYSHSMSVSFLPYTLFIRDGTAPSLCF